MFGDPFKNKILCKNGESVPVIKILSAFTRYQTLTNVLEIALRSKNIDYSIAIWSSSLEYTVNDILQKKYTLYSILKMWVLWGVFLLRLVSGSHLAVPAYLQAENICPSPSQIPGAWTAYGDHYYLRLNVQASYSTQDINCPSQMKLVKWDTATIKNFMAGFSSKYQYTVHILCKLQNDQIDCILILTWLVSWNDKLML